MRSTVVTFKTKYNHKLTINISNNKLTTKQLDAQSYWLTINIINNKLTTKQLDAQAY